MVYVYHVYQNDREYTYTLAYTSELKTGIRYGQTRYTRGPETPQRRNARKRSKKGSNEGTAERDDKRMGQAERYTSENRELAFLAQNWTLNFW